MSQPTNPPPAPANGKAAGRKRRKGRASPTQAPATTKTPVVPAAPSPLPAAAGAPVAPEPAPAAALAGVPTASGGRLSGLPTLNDLTANIKPAHAALATVAVLAVALGFWFFWRYRFVMIALVAGLFLHIAIKPAIDALERRRVNRRLGVTIVYSLLFLALAGLVGALVPMITGQVGAFTEQVPDLYRGLRNYLLQSELDLLPRLGRLLPPSWNMQQLGQIVMNSMGNSSAQASPLLVLSQIGTAIFYLLTTFGLGYYLTLDRERLVGNLLSRLPQTRRPAVHNFINEVELSVGRFVRGQLVLCAVVGVASALAYWLIGLPYALALGAIAAVLEAVPMIGPVLTAVPAGLLAATIGPQQVIYVVIALAVIQTLESNVLVPRIMDKAVGVSPLVSVLALTFFGLLFGLPGALLAIPIAAVIQIVLNRSVFNEPAAATESLIAAPVNMIEVENPVAAGRSKLDLLRLEASELAQDVRKQLRSAPADESGDPTPDAASELEDLIEITAGALYTLLTETQQAEVQTLLAGQQPALQPGAAVPSPATQQQAASAPLGGATDAKPAVMVVETPADARTEPTPTALASTQTYKEAP